MRNTQITKYKNLKSTKEGVNISLLEWLKDETHKKLVLYLRSLTDKKERQKFKATMPCVTISGTFSERKVDGLIKHSGFLCLDVDGQDNLDINSFEELRDELSNIENVAYCGLSAGGNGVFCLIPISDTVKHKEHFLALQLCFEKLGIVIDKACSDVPRLRICSYDPDAYFNESALVFTGFIDSKKNGLLKKERNVVENTIPKTILRINSQYNSDNTEKRVMKIIDDINSRGFDITGIYDNWFKIGCALSSHFGEQGRDMFHLLSKHYSGYSSGTTDSKFDECLKNSVNSPIGIGTFFFIAETYGLK